MKQYYLAILVLLFLSCEKEDALEEDYLQNNVIEISPNQTDGAYSLGDAKHLILRNKTTHLDKLVVFIGGTNTTPNNYKDICNHIATIGYDVIDLAYPNKVAAYTLSSNTDPNVFDFYREEICFGISASNYVAVDLLNCIGTRATKLMLYLKNNYPEQKWSQYLTPSNTLLWDKIIVSGHSQGAGHACYLGYKKNVHRVVMFSGPNDYSTYFHDTANWLKTNSITPINRYYSLLHKKDEVISFNYQVKNLRSIGILLENENPAQADNSIAPYSNKHSLFITIPALSFHDSTVELDKKSKIQGIWTYLFTHNQ